MTSPSDTLEALASFRDSQLQKWPLARGNYDALALVERRRFKVGALEGAFQYNPARAVSTGAKIDAASINKRPCFLCSANRPAVQESLPVMPGWEFLLNPYPIFPLHFTIACSEHKAQGEIPLEMAAMAETLPGMAIFYNGARAGASAPDHLHCQAVMKSELPLLVYLEEGGDLQVLPYDVVYETITPDMEGMARLARIPSIAGIDKETHSPDAGLLNAFMWIGADGLLRVAVVIRSAHRPACYSATEGERLMVSPGAVDVAGIVILPRKEDFERITPEMVAGIYSEVCVPPKNEGNAQ